MYSDRFDALTPSEIGDYNYLIASHNSLQRQLALVEERIGVYEDKMHEYRMKLERERQTDKDGFNKWVDEDEDRQTETT